MTWFRQDIVHGDFSVLLRTSNVCYFELLYLSNTVNHMRVDMPRY